MDNVEEVKLVSSSSNNKIKELFKFLDEYNNIKNPVITEIENQPWKKWMDNVGENKYIINNIYNNLYEEDVIFSVDKPNRIQCPKPPEEIRDWLIKGWEDSKQEVIVLEEVTLDEEDDISIIKFYDNDKRVTLYKEWLVLRNEWAIQDIEARIADEIFTEFYSLYATLKKDMEAIELVFGDAILTCNSKKKIHHPILIQSIKLKFDANIPSFSIVDEDKGTELYKNIFGDIEDYNHELISDISKEFDEEQYKPYEKEISNQFLNRLVHGLSPKGEFIEENKNAKPTNKFPIIYRKPVIFIRKRNLGFGVAIHSILKDLETNEEIPEFLNDVVGIETISDDKEKPVTESQNSNDLLEVNGVDQEILLTKPANLEQLSVAKHLKKNNAVLVQGPPGTGKTHTISNIIGHLLSEGKSILVTSYSEKALSVLKDKVDPNLQALCLSLLSGVDNRREMEITLDEINGQRAKLEPTALIRKISSLEEQRIATINKLSELEICLKNARTNEYRPIIIGGVEFKPTDAAKFIKKNKNLLFKVPTPIKLGEEITLSTQEINELYYSNEQVSIDEEKEYDARLPEIYDIITPNEFKVIIDEKNKFDSKKLEYGKELWNTDLNENNIDRLVILNNNVKEALAYIDFKNLWTLETITVSKEDDKKLWENLISEIDNLNKLFSHSREFILKYNPKINNIEALQNIDNTFLEIINKLENRGKITRVNLFLNKNIKNLIDSCNVNGKNPNNLEHFRGLFEYYKYISEVDKLKLRWDRQMAVLGAESASSMGMTFEKTTKKYSVIIQNNLNWYKNIWNPIINRIANCGLNINSLMEKIDISSDRYSELKYLKNTLAPKIEDLIESEILRIEYNKIVKNKNKIETSIYEKCNDSSSLIMNKMKKAVVEENIVLYEQCYNEIIRIKKLGPYIARRRMILKQLQIVAPEWTRLIQNRIGVHGEVQVFNNVKDDWKYTQFVEEINKRNSVSIDVLQTEITKQEKDLRENTAQLAFNKAWLSMIEKLDSNKGQVQAIEGWRQLIRKIGAGKGKNAEKYKNAARKLMPACQGAVPVWIMPLNKVVENFNPEKNKFDVVIIDEASQADIMAIVALYLGKQVIIVGDNEQVSPLAIGEKLDEIDRLSKEYLSEIPNNALYCGRFSIYDLAQASGYQPVRLKEHFRCVPEIIQFSNMLSYNNQIKALRDSSKVKTKPPIITYKVENSISVNKVNTKEAEVITSLILSCCERSEYKGKTFGVITLRGEKQATTIDKMLQIRMTPKEYNDRNILCGNSSQFQGDERDIIFISMVDVNDGVGPMRLVSYGTDDSNKKRYNVAVSRAKDQLWVIHSLDTENDLKLGDLRKELLDYCNDYNSRQVEFEKNVIKAESVFEKEVMKYLIDRGYSIVPQWEVGAYRIDMVITYKDNKVALECDGEKWHGEDKLMEDMNRQAILERLGWRFIRITGSEYFSDETTAMENVISKLNNLYIYPENKYESIKEENSEIVSEITSKAFIIREEWKNEE